MILKEGYKRAVELYNHHSNTQNGRQVISFFAEHGASKWDLEWFANCSAKEGIKAYVLLADYKDWKRYVLSYYKKIGKKTPDLKELSYSQAIQIIDSCKRYFAKPNPIYNKDGVYVGAFNCYQDANMLPISTSWCITKTPKRYNEFCSNGKQGLYIINNNNEPPYRNVIVIISKGNVEYWDSTNSRMSEIDDEIERFKNYEQTIPNEAKQIIYNIAASQTEQLENSQENINCNRNMNRNRIRLTESQLHNVIRESVKQVLSELDWRTYVNYQIARQNQAKQAEQQGDFEAANKYRTKAILGGNAAGEALRKKYGYKDIDDFNQQQQAVRDNATEKYGNQSDIVKQRAQNYNQEASDYFSGKSQYVKGKGWVTKSDD